MRRSKGGWRLNDLDTLYRGFGFDRKEGGKHCLFVHPVFPDLRATVTRSSTIPVGYVTHAVRTIDALLARERERC
jgi:hypothetical protein